MDRLSAIFTSFIPRARVFFAGSGCKKAAFDECDGVGHLHILKSGQMTLTQLNGEKTIVSEPSVLFYPRPTSHRFESCSGENFEILCASINLGIPAVNPFCDALPECVLLSLNSFQGLDSLFDLLFIEAFKDHCGRQVALDNLVGYFLVVLLRHLIDVGNYPVGILAGLSDIKLAKALTAIHNKPAYPWTLEHLAEEAGMSRARFAAHFKTVINTTPMDYVSRWRMGIAQSLLKQGYSIKQIAPKVGYQSAASMTRTFSSRLGMPPSMWLGKLKEQDFHAELKNLDTYVPVNF
jgi:AraC-like DNA-binding protein